MKAHMDVDQTNFIDEKSTVKNIFPQIKYSNGTKKRYFLKHLIQSQSPTNFIRTLAFILLIKCTINVQFFEKSCLKMVLFRISNIHIFIDSITRNSYEQNTNIETLFLQTSRPHAENLEHQIL